MKKFVVVCSVVVGMFGLIGGTSFNGLQQPDKNLAIIIGPGPDAAPAATTINA